MPTPEPVAVQRDIISKIHARHADQMQLLIEDVHIHNFLIEYRDEIGTGIDLIILKRHLYALMGCLIDGAIWITRYQKKQ